MAEVVIAHGGTINEFIGDAIFAVYGAPVVPTRPRRAGGRHRPRDAGGAGRRSTAERRARRGLPAFEMGIGLHTGEAVVSATLPAPEQRAKHCVVGSAANIRKPCGERATVGGQVLLTARNPSWRIGTLALGRTSDRHSGQGSPPSP